MFQNRDYFPRLCTVSLQTASNKGKDVIRNWLALFLEDPLSISKIVYTIDEYGKYVFVTSYNENDHLIYDY